MPAKIISRSFHIYFYLPNQRSSPRLLETKNRYIRLIHPLILWWNHRRIKEEEDKLRSFPDYTHYMHNVVLTEPNLFASSVCGLLVWLSDAIFRPPTRSHQTIGLLYLVV